MDTAAREPKSREGTPGGSGMQRPLNRRSFLFAIGVALNAVAGLLLAIPLVGYVFSSLRYKTQQAWVSLGPLTNFPEHQTRLAKYQNPFVVPWDGPTSDIPCWVRRLSGETFQVFAINCTHLGCPVRWFAESGLFMCPCHGGVYYEDGSRASGPPPRGLYRYEHRVRNGQLWVLGGQRPTLSERV
jgi:menaquinol-cytochrome c reductase iron-sulfur subunit